MYYTRNIEARSRSHFCRGKAVLHTVKSEISGISRTKGLPDIAIFRISEYWAGSFFSSLSAKQRPHARACVRHIPRLGTGNGSVNGPTQSIAMMIIFRKHNKNSLGLQQMLKMLPSLTHALHVPAEYAVINSLEFFPGNCFNLVADVVF
jgi:hypothetical protein